MSSSASLLACGICQASGQIFITQTLGIKGYRTVLALDNVPGDVQEYSWYWGANDSAGNMIISHKPSSAQQPGPMYTGRERVNREGSLLIRPTALNDTGNYTVRVVAGNETQRATGWLEVLGGLAGALFPNPQGELDVTHLREGQYTEHDTGSGNHGAALESCVPWTAPGGSEGWWRRGRSWKTSSPVFDSGCKYILQDPGPFVFLLCSSVSSSVEWGGTHHCGLS